MNPNKHFAYDHHPVPFDFKQTVERFFVEEVPLYDYSSQGNYLILKIKKTDMSTWKLLTVLAKATGLKERDIGYAGLKDKNATTIQYLSLPKHVEKELDKNLTTSRVEILEHTYHKAPIKIGALKGNRFVIDLHHIKESDARFFNTTAKMMQSKGIPNYFGYQRFGEDMMSYQQGREIAHSGKRLKGSREKLMVAAYQSHLFNHWLGERLKLSKIIEHHSPKEAAKILDYPPALVEELAKQPQLFKLFQGDIMQPYPHGKSSIVRDMQQSALLFAQKQLSATGLLCGAHAQRSRNDAYHLEAPFDDAELTSLKGDRRFAWIWPKEVETVYDPGQQRLKVSFYLPKGAYATTFLEEIGKFPLKEAPSSSKR
jgi:tRNA pseudouridine13 synthase